MCAFRLPRALTRTGNRGPSSNGAAGRDGGLGGCHTGRGGGGWWPRPRGAGWSRWSRGLADAPITSAPTAAIRPRVRLRRRSRRCSTARTCSSRRHPDRPRRDVRRLRGRLGHAAGRHGVGAHHLRGRSGRGARVGGHQLEERPHRRRDQPRARQRLRHHQGLHRQQRRRPPSPAPASAVIDSDHVRSATTSPTTTGTWGIFTGFSDDC